VKNAQELAISYPQAGSGDEEAESADTSETVQSNEDTEDLAATEGR